jgi:hypothetical protein
MAQVVALASNRRGRFLSNQTPDQPAARGLETTESLDNAKRFADQAAIDAWVTSMGGTPSAWVAMTLP